MLVSTGFRSEIDMTDKPLFGDLIAAHPGLAENLMTADVAADLALLLHHSGKSRAELARLLGWTRARVTQVLAPDGNLTIQTVAAVAKALGFTFDLVFRKASTSAPAQPWSQQMSLHLEDDPVLDFKTWMNRNSMPPIKRYREDPQILEHFKLTLRSSNDDLMQAEVDCAA
jgi:DNA-binding phage protein